MAEWVKRTARTTLNFAIGVRVSCSAACLHDDMRSVSGAQKKNAAEGQPLRGEGGMFQGRTPWEIPQEAFPAERECRGGCEPEYSYRARDEKFRRAAENRHGQSKIKFHRSQRVLARKLPPSRTHSATRGRPEPRRSAKRKWLAVGLRASGKNDRERLKITPPGHVFRWL